MKTITYTVNYYEKSDIIKNVKNGETYTFIEYDDFNTAVVQDSKGKVIVWGRSIIDDPKIFVFIK